MKREVTDLVQNCSIFIKLKIFCLPISKRLGKRNYGGKRDNYWKNINWQAMVRKITNTIMVW